MISYGQTRDGFMDIRGLSTDAKPTVVPFDVGGDGVMIPNGSTFFEMDTNKVYLFDAEHGEWTDGEG